MFGYKNCIFLQEHICIYIYSSTNPFEDTLDKTFECRYPRPALRPALGYSKTLEKPLGCSATLEKTLGFPQPLEKTYEKSLGWTQPLEKLLC